MKNITIAGRIGKDAVMRHTKTGDPVLGFSVAVDDGYGQNKRTLWFECSMWGKRGESLEQHLKKGTALAVSGDLSTRDHDGKTYLTVRVADVTLQGGGEKPARQERQQSYGDASGGGYGHGPSDLGDDEVPF